eukprot:TRINITY_DN1112_c0_g1_i4.p1 TRINITY_DN1112_c0_g1~~TRINITY_DN1112_c0_g1_i4.p1  ORF type:complete len:136 (+),score=22.54 TRINITY_DN1112_c0_g1_i4:599-1006(+)
MAEFWIEKVLRHIPAHSQRVNKEVFAECYRDYMHERWKTNKLPLEKVYAVLKQTCGAKDDSITIQDFVIFLERFGPFPDSLRKASALIDYDTNKGMLWFAPTGSDGDLDARMKENGLKWMVRPSGQKNDAERPRL